MASYRKLPEKHGAPRTAPPAAPGGEPAWADGLRRLYDSVVEEPLPDAFKELLERLDELKPGGGN